MELRKYTSRNFSTTTTGFTHSTYNLEILDVVSNNLLSIIPEFVINPLSDQLKRWLRSEGILSWHIEIIDEAYCLLFSFHWPILVLGLSLEIRLDNFLYTH